MQLPGLALLQLSLLLHSSAHTAQEKESRSLGLALRQENLTRALPCWSTVPYAVFLSQLKSALNSLDESMRLRLP